MFEKEAEEWVRENMDCCRTDNSVNQPIPYFDEEERCIAKSAFIDGAEFGYHEGFKDCAKSRLNVTTISDCPGKDEVQLEYARTIIKDLLFNSDEYARQRAIDFLMENE